MILFLLACTEERTDTGVSVDAKATADTAETKADCVPTPDVHEVPAMPVRFDASAVIADAKTEGEEAYKLTVWLIALTFEEYDEKRCADTLSTDYVKAAYLQDLTEYSWMDVDLTGAEGWSVAAATTNEDEVQLGASWFGEVHTAGSAEGTVKL